MRWTYDSEVEALYVYLRDEPVLRQVSVEDRFVLDLSADGAVVGLEVLAAESPWSPQALIGVAYLAPQDLRSLDLLSKTWHLPVVWAPIGRVTSQPPLHANDEAPVYA